MSFKGLGHNGRLTALLSTSLGGLLLKQWLVTLDKYSRSQACTWHDEFAAFLDSIVSIAFLAVPHLGANMAAKAYHVPFSSSWLEVLRKCSSNLSVLRKLANNFQDVYRARGIPVLCILEGKKTTVMVLNSCCLALLQDGCGPLLTVMAIGKRKAASMTSTLERLL